MRSQAAVVGVVVAVALLAALPASAQNTRYGAWTYSVSEDDFSGRTSRIAYASGDELMLFVFCLTDDYALNVRMGGEIFRDGDIDMRWDEGAVESYTFKDDNQSLSASTSAIMDDYNPGARAIVAKLMAHSELRVRVGRWPSTTVTDRISLRGSSRAIGALGCE